MSTQKEVDELQKSFQGLDRNKDGFLSKDELIEGYTAVLKSRKIAEEEVEKILQFVDINQSGQIDFSGSLL
jgi:calcium-dependent protein kinase